MISTRALAAGLFAGMAAVLAWTALAIDLRALIVNAPPGHLGEVLYGYFRFFTIDTNTFGAALMSLTAWRSFRVGPQIPASWYRAQVVYLIVTGATYELLLRRLWSPHGWQFATDMVFHDVEPTLAVLFWVFAAPKDLHWRGLSWLLLYPLAYFAATLLGGALGAGYPYDFLDVTLLGYPTVVAIAFVFLAVFLVLGTLLTAAGRVLTTRGGEEAFGPAYGERNARVQETRHVASGP